MDSECFDLGGHLRGCEHRTSVPEVGPISACTPTGSTTTSRPGRPVIVPSVPDLWQCRYT